VDQKKEEEKGGPFGDLPSGNKRHADVKKGGQKRKEARKRKTRMQRLNAHIKGLYGQTKPEKNKSRHRTTEEKKGEGNAGLRTIQQARGGRGAFLPGKMSKPGQSKRRE